jgi:hypothetical protein
MSEVKSVNREQVSNGAEAAIGTGPYRVEVDLTGTADMLFHRWNNEGVAGKAAARKNSAAKKTDDIESYVWRNPKDELCIPGEYLRQAIVHAAKYRQDPRSPRKSAMDLFKASIVALTALASLGTKKWDYEDRRRAVIQRNAITRVRPAMLSGWKATFELLVLSPEYIDEAMLQDTIVQAGMLIGLADYRPTYGRFRVTKFTKIGK